MFHIIYFFMMILLLLIFSLFYFVYQDIFILFNLDFIFNFYDFDLISDCLSISQGCESSCNFFHYRPTKIPGVPEKAYVPDFRIFPPDHLINEETLKEQALKEQALREYVLRVQAFEEAKKIVIHDTCEFYWVVVSHALKFILVVTPPVISIMYIFKG